MSRPLDFLSGNFYFLNFLKRGRERKRKREEAAHRRTVGETSEKGEEGEGRRREVGGREKMPFSLAFSPFFLVFLFFLFFNYFFMIF